MDKHFADRDLFEINVGLGTVYGIMLTVRARILLIGLINWPLSGSQYSQCLLKPSYIKIVLFFFEDLGYLFKSTSSRQAVKRMILENYAIHMRRCNFN